MHISYNSGKYVFTPEGLVEAKALMDFAAKYRKLGASLLAPEKVGRRHYTVKCPICKKPCANKAGRAVHIAMKHKNIVATNLA